MLFETFSRETECTRHQQKMLEVLIKFLSRVREKVVDTLFVILSPQACLVKYSQAKAQNVDNMLKCLKLVLYLCSKYCCV